MSSFVTEVLVNSGSLEKENLSSKISKLSRKIEDTKEEVSGMLNKRYNDLLPSLQASEDLMVQVDEVSIEMDTLKKIMETEVQPNINEAAAEYTKLKQQLEKNTLVISLLGHLKEFHYAMENSNKALMEKEYVDAANELEKARMSMESLKGWKDTELPLLSALRSELTMQRENLVYHLGDEWKRLVIWKLPPLKEPTDVAFFLKVELCLSHASEKDSEAQPDVLANVLQSLAIQGDLQHKINLFSQVLLKYMLKPVVLHPSLSVSVTEQQGKGVVLTFEERKGCHEEHTAPSQVYREVLMVLKTLHANLLDVAVGDKKLSTIFGELIWEELSRCIIHECLLYSIPTKSSQLEKYNKVIKETEEFEKALIEMKFLQGESTNLLKYARDVNCHFASKKCLDVIVAARKLMTSQMHSTVKIMPESKLRLPKLPPPDGLPPVKKEHPSEQSGTATTMENASQLSVWSMCLPACRISESVQQLMELALNTLEEAIRSSPQCASQLFFTVRNIFELFYDVVPTYHKENFLKFPHLAAIQHNNCMYLAHHFLTLGHYFRPHLPQPLNQGLSTFVDMVPAFRKLGAQCFLAQMNVQKGELLERLSSAHNFCNLDDADNFKAASKAVRQVIHQLKQLGTVWQDVLPASVYCKAIGTLLNTAIMEMIAKIMMLEDISSEEGEHLHALCQTVIEEGPLVFVPLTDEHKNKKYQEEVPLYVKKWSAFKELAIVLLANLQEIVDRWADNKGPLALEFTSTEVKSLIRALFQNTDRRAIAMTKIK
ncbi:centromere/kinetochore protein zw10 homolog [Corythoichthys intestinalis]|uniref:centromere/kinetochore protein zw10 homolog n=1 Tax=Corythoichthys intestinalis TaxID=161448 RepID=UPI0025A55515|nr:centromere/kinetochore protein zw10 homolog [Corythoichthys intestinalis]XP_061801810.1 centromere/kinetochore protein zw10 homolog [Nerophis lumbriciformis]